MNMLATFLARGAASPQLQAHLARIDDYLYVAEDGMKMQGYNGSQLWDTSFALQALADAPAHVIERFERPLTKVVRGVVWEAASCCKRLLALHRLTLSWTRRKSPRMSRIASATSAPSAKGAGHSQPRVSDERCPCILHRGRPTPTRIADHGWPIADCTSEAMLAVLGEFKLDLECAYSCPWHRDVSFLLQLFATSSRQSRGQASAH